MYPTTAASGPSTRRSAPGIADGPTSAAAAGTPASTHQRFRPKTPAIPKPTAAGQLQSPRTVNPAVDEKLEAICMKALAHNREERYESAAEFAAAIEQALDATGDRSSLRDAGKLIQQHFEPERARIKALVDDAPGGVPLAQQSHI
jgi:hypothetical protein